MKIVLSKMFSLSDKSYIKGKVDEILGPAKEAIDVELIIVNHVDRTPSARLT